MNPIQHVYVINPWCCGGGGGGFAATDASPAPNRGIISDRSGTIARPASQEIAAANVNRGYFFIQNISEDVLWLNFGIAAVMDSPSIKLYPDATFEMNKFNSTDSINLIGPVGAKFVAKEG